MKRVISYLTVAILSFLFVSCKPTEKPLNIVGEWNLNSIELKSATLGGQTIDVYLSFTEDGKFNMYQMLEVGRYRAYSGTWTLSGTTLTGKYTDGSSWGSKYTVAVDNNTMTLTTEDGKECDHYVRKAIPESVISNAI